MNTLSGNSGHSCNITIEESDDSSFAEAYRIKTIATFTEVLGDSSTEALVNQRIVFAGNTTDRFIRAKRVIAGASNPEASFTGKITCKLLAEEKV